MRMPTGYSKLVSSSVPRWDQRAATWPGNRRRPAARSSRSDTARTSGASGTPIESRSVSADADVVTAESATGRCVLTATPTRSCEASGDAQAHSMTSVIPTVLARARRATLSSIASAESPTAETTIRLFCVTCTSRSRGNADTTRDIVRIIGRIGQFAGMRERAREICQVTARHSRATLRDHRARARSRHACKVLLDGQLEHERARL
jgi:hypothetical protein